MNLKKYVSKIAVIFLLFLIHALVFSFSFNAIGLIGIVLATVPIIVAAWAFGRVGGGVTALLAVLVNLVLVSQVRGGVDVMEPGIIIGSIYLTLLGVFAGWTTDKDRQIKKELRERKEVEQKLAQAESWYRSIFDGVNDAIFVESTRGDVLDVNMRACEIFGWEREEFLTKTVWDMVPPEYQALVPDETNEKNLLKEPFETVNIRSNGEYFPVSVSGRIQMIENRKRLLVVVRDITEQKKIENELKRHHQFLSHVIESFSQPFYVVNVEDYSIEIANSAARRDKAIESATTCYSLTHQREIPCQGKSAPCPLKEVVEQRKAVRVEHIHHDKNGKIKHFEIHGYPIFNARGQVHQMIEYSLDITERKNAEAELHKLSRAITQSPTSVVITDLEGRIEYVNPAFTKVTGYTREEALTKNPRILKSGVHDATFYKNIWDTLIAGKVWHGELCNKNKAGDFFWESASISPVANSEGDITHYVSVKEDITKRKKATLELEKAKDAAEAAAKAKADFLANMSHEIRTPLNAIYGMTALMMDTPLNAEQEDFITTIRSGSDTLLSVINDILDFSKIEAGKMKLEHQPFSLSGCVEDAIALLTENATRKKLKLVYAIEKGTPSVVVGDITRLRQILVNLLNNAIKFTEEGDIVVNIRSRGTENNQHELVFRIRDKGIGIPEDKIGKLFESFSQVDSSTTRKYGGTGLGLAISRELAEKMGGTMWVESEEGKGSTFFFTILVEEAKEIKPKEKTKIDFALGERNPLRILLAEDNLINQKVAQKLLERLGYSIDIAKNGIEALDALKKEKYDVVFMDIQMPEMDGDEATKHIRENFTLEKQPYIIAMTAHALEGDREKYIARGMDDYISKPISVEALIGALEKASPRP